MDDPGKLRVSTPVLLYKVQSHAYRNVGVSMFVARFNNLLGVC